MLRSAASGSCHATFSPEGLVCPDDVEPRRRRSSSLGPDHPHRVDDRDDWPDRALRLRQGDRRLVALKRARSSHDDANGVGAGLDLRSRTPSHALDSEQKRGKALLQSLCSRCHAVDRTGASPHADAPSFRTFGDSKLYDDDFAQRLQTGVSTIHKDMPSFQLDRADAEAAVSYLKAIQVRPGKR